MFDTVMKYEPVITGDYNKIDIAVSLKDRTTRQRCTSSRQAVMLVGEY